MAIRCAPDFARAHNERAWILATCTDAAHRNGKQALSSAERACDLTQWKLGVYLDTLAAAYAELGEFKTAVCWQEKAISSLLPDESQERPGMQTRLKLYQNRKTYSE
jgi:tetratricopeptide (TPR) repeat protein